MDPVQGSSNNQKHLQNAEATSTVKGYQKLSSIGSQCVKGSGGISTCPTPSRAKTHQPSLQHKYNKTSTCSKKEKQDSAKRGILIPGNNDKKRATPTGNVKSGIGNGNKDVCGNTSLRNLESKQKRRVDDRRFFHLAGGKRKSQTEILIGKKPTKHNSICPQENVQGSSVASEPSKSNETILQSAASGTAGHPNFQKDSVRPKLKSEGSEQEHLKSVLRVLRSNLSPADKLRAIKSNKEHWEQKTTDSNKASCCKEALQNEAGSNCGQSQDCEYTNLVKTTSCNEEAHHIVTGSPHEDEMEEVHASEFKNSESKMCKNGVDVAVKESDQQELHGKFIASGSNRLSRISEASSLSSKDGYGHVGCHEDRFCDSGGDDDGKCVAVEQNNLAMVASEWMDLGLAQDQSQDFTKESRIENLDICAEGISLENSEISECNFSVIKGNRITDVVQYESKEENIFHPIECAKSTESQNISSLRDKHKNCDPLICDDAMDLISIQSPELEDPMTNDIASCAMDTTKEKAAVDAVSSMDPRRHDNYVEVQSPSISRRRSQNTLAPMSLSVDIKDGSLSSNQSARAAPKSPVTVQEWVDSIDVIDNRTEDGSENVAKENILNHSHEGEDNLGLGAEAYNLNKKDDTLNAQTSCKPASRKGAWGKARTPNSSFQSEVSNLSNGSLSSVEALLETMQHDPEDILLGLGFGKTVAHPLNRIPQRFLHPSQVPGNNLNQFLEKQDEMLELYDMGFCGYRGLSGFRMDGHIPSGIVCKILEKIRDRNRELKRSLPTPNLTVSSPSLSFYHAVFSLMAVNAFRSAIRSTSSKNSILDPKNREFLDSQEEGSIKPRGKRRPRLVLGKESYAMDTDEELIDDESSEKLSPRQRQVSPSEVSTVSSDLSGRHRILSDDVFVPAAKTPKLWEIVRDRRLASDSSKSVQFEAVRAIVDVPETGNITENASNNQSPCKDTNSSELPKRLSRLTRQMSVDEELESESDLSGRHPKLGSLKTETAPYKDSFELEELPASSDLPDDDNLCQLQANIRDAPRTGSAMSDSSGFLEGETLETSNIDILDDMLPEFATHKTTHKSSSLMLDSQQNSLDVLPSVAEDGFYAGVNSDEDGGTKSGAGRHSPLLNMSESGFESFGTQEKEDYLSEPGPTNGGQSPVGYLSESDTVVVDFASSSSGDAISSQTERSPISSSCDLHTSTQQPPNQATSSTKSTKPATSKDWCGISHPIRTQMRLLNPRGSDLFKSISEVDLNRLGSLQAQKSRQNSLENISFEDSGAVAKELPRLVNKESHPTSRESLLNGRCERIGEFHESCLLTIQRMHEIIQLYQKKLKQMERTCWGTYHQLFPGITKPEREELEKLCELRKLVLVETSKTQMLLSHRSAAIKSLRPPSCHTSCDLRLVTVAEELGELLREQSAIYDQLNELNCESLPQTSQSWQREHSPGASRQMHLDELPKLLSNVKHEVMTEVKDIIHEDHEKFQSELVSTRQGIEDVKSVLTALLSVIKSGKS